MTEMSDGPDSPGVASGLGPHVVGHRVVVRRLVPGERGPSGGPALTDVLGVCVAWEPGDAVVVLTDDEQVRIPLDLVVAGKPVPPRASIRRRVSTLDAELHGLAMWPGLETERLGEWVHRWHPDPGDRPRKRANSTLAVGDPSVAMTHAARAVETWHAARGRSPMVQVEQDSDVDRWFAEHGWDEVPGGAAEFWLAPTSRVARAAGRSAFDALVSESGPRAGFAHPQYPGAEISAALHDDWLGLHTLQVSPDLRRRGIARSLVAEALDWGASMGATTCWIHVEQNNAAAKAFYARLGFEPHHRLRYRVSTSAGSSASPDPSGSARAS